jgi:phage-related protein
VFEVIFFYDRRGNEPTAEFIKELRHKSSTDKNARINFNKIVAYIDILCEHGTRVGEPVVKHLEDEIWELRPLDNRILFAYYKDKIYILLHHFNKKSNKTPPGEIEQAKRNLTDYIERNGE